MGAPSFHSLLIVEGWESTNLNPSPHEQRTTAPPQTLLRPAGRQARIVRLVARPQTNENRRVPHPCIGSLGSRVGVHALHASG